MRKHVAAGVSVSVAVGLFAVLGGTGLAQTALAPAQELVAQNQSAGKAEICHKGRNTINISVNAVPAHLRHGDTENVCAVAAPTTETTDAAKAKKVKKQSADGAESPETGKTKKPKGEKGAQRASLDVQQETAEPAKGKSAKKAKAGTSAESSVAHAKPFKAKKQKKLSSKGGFASPPGLSGAFPPGHASGNGNGKNK